MSGSAKIFLAVDVGASSGRVLAGKISGGRLNLEEVHRFSNGGILAGGVLYWDILAQWRAVLDGMRSAADRFPAADVTSIGVDTWGVDFGLLGPHDELLGNPVHYRDRRTAGVMEATFATVPREEIFERTGIQFMELNTLYQLVAMSRSEAALLSVARSFLMIPDLFHWLMTGEKGNELTNATTTQCYDPRRGDWCRDILARLNVPSEMFGQIVLPGGTLGALRADVAEETGLAQTHVVLPGTHDTASAVVAVPARGKATDRPNWCYISSGTWSLMGAETAAPVINAKCRELNFTNEGGVGSTNRLLKNIAGLWLIQECRRVWDVQGKTFDWERLVAMAEAASPLTSLIDPDAPNFVAPADMPASIREFCQRTQQPVPASEGAVIRCALESLALRYRAVLRSLEELLGRRIDTIHIVGGGSRNELLCQMTATACQCEVVTGPVEATALGNVIVQAVAAGEIESIAAGRELIRESFETKRFVPADPVPWDEAFERFQGLTA